MAVRFCRGAPVTAGRSVNLINTMPQKWTIEEETIKKAELTTFYIDQNKTISETGRILGIAPQTVYDRLIKLGIKPRPHLKPGYLAKRINITLPTYSTKLAEFVGIMLGDGHISHRPAQFYITISEIDKGYSHYVAKLLFDLFETHVTYIYRKSKQVKIVNVMISSVDLIKYLCSIGLKSSNKVKDQASVPYWIVKNKHYHKSFIRGLFDTDGSIYKLKFGVQMAFCNCSQPLLKTTKQMLTAQGYHPSKISSHKFYLTKQKDLRKYMKEIGFGNPKHETRAQLFGLL